jgi:hemerythrin
MAMLAWQAQYSVGVKGIDRQHRELLARVNALFEAIGSHEPGEQIEALLNFLRGYVHTHFACEERLMRRHAYPGYARHLAEHQRFIDELGSVDALYDRSAPAEPIVARMSAFVSRWFTDHFQREDRLLAEYLREGGVHLHTTPAPAEPLDRDASSSRTRRSV